jgi:hypothetical protein
LLELEKEVLKMSLDLFISYSRINLPFIYKIDSLFSDLGISVWFDKKSLLPGQKWENVIEDQIKNSKIFLTFISQKGMDKRGYFHVEQNLATQAALRIPPEQLFILPVTLGECSVPKQFRQYHVINLADEGAIDMLLLSIGVALNRTFEANTERIEELRHQLINHLGEEIASNKEFESRLLNDEITFQDSAGLIERIANSHDANRLAMLLKLRALPQISYAEQQAFDIAITNVKQGIQTEALQAKSVSKERENISKMGISGNKKVTLQLQANKYARFISRKNSPVYDMAQQKILEFISLGIKGLDE